MTTLALIGAGKIGGQVARSAIAVGYEVVLSNSRSPETLAELVAELGPRASAAWATEAAAAADVAVVAIPFGRIGELDPEPLAGKVVLDANNYYFERDGHVARLDETTATTSGLLQERLAGSRVVKAFNHIHFKHIGTHGKPAGDPERRALSVASDHDDARAFATRLYDEFGFDTVDLGPLSESWRVERDQPAYTAVETAAQLRESIARATR
jgi:predicted dinucleotide-binding enzyme